VTAGPAVLHGAIAEEFAAADDLPCADSAFLVPLKRSAEFRHLRSRLAGQAPHPVADSWLDDGFHFFVFGLAPGGLGNGGAADPGVAVFAMHRDSPDPVSAIVVVPTDRPGLAEITNLRGPGGSYVAPLPASWPTSDGD
jgi:hypothetical protein